MDTVSFFLVQHGDLHSATVAGSPTYADRIFAGLTDDQMRARPGPGLNSLVWLLWHMARTEDVSVNLVVADGSQVFDDDWARRLNAPWRIIGTGMPEGEVAELTAHADIAALRAYRDAVGRRTQGIVRTLKPAAWEEIIGVADTARAAQAGAFRSNTAWVEGTGYRSWQDQSRAARLAGGALRHNAIHLGEAITVRGLGGFPLGV
ncbi:MAG: DinB family protein [Candidatus Rokuibacteriota bacterium]